MPDSWIKDNAEGNHPDWVWEDGSTWWLWHTAQLIAKEGNDGRSKDSVTANPDRCAKASGPACWTGYSQV